MNQRDNKNISGQIIETTLMSRKGRKIYPITGNEMTNLGGSGAGVTLFSVAASYFIATDERVAGTVLFVLAVCAIVFNFYTIYKIKRSATPFEH